MAAYWSHPGMGPSRMGYDASVCSGNAEPGLPLYAAIQYRTSFFGAQSVELVMREGFLFHLISRSNYQQSRHPAEYSPIFHLLQRDIPYFSKHLTR